MEWVWLLCYRGGHVTYLFWSRPDFRSAANSVGAIRRRAVIGAARRCLDALSGLAQVAGRLKPATESLSALRNFQRLSPEGRGPDWYRLAGQRTL